MTAVLALLAAALLAARLALMVALHLVASPYRPVRDAFSDYALGPTRPLAAAASLLNAGAWAALAAAVATTAAPWTQRPSATTSLIALAALSLAVIAAPTDLPGARRTALGIAHYVIAITTFALAYSLTGDASRWAVTVMPDLIAVPLAALRWISLAGLVGLVAGLVLPPGRPVFGLAERVFLFAIAAFYLTFSIGLLTLA